MGKKNYSFLFLGPVLFLSILLFAKIIQIEDQSTLLIYKTIAAIGWILTWWITEIVPIPVTALLPLILFPILEILPLKIAAQSYAHPIIYLFLGGFLMALAIQRHNLHIRIALLIIQRVGLSEKRLLLGFMLTTALLSMWISNTSTTIMMLPVAISVLNVMNEGQQRVSQGFSLRLLLGIAYSANIGGITTIIGTPPNLLLIAFLREELSIELGFSHWLLFALPLGIVLLFLTHLLLSIGLRTVEAKNETTKSFNKTGAYLKEKLKEIGRLKLAELKVIVIFSIAVFAWILKIPINNLFDISMSDTMIALVGGTLMFCIPFQKENKNFLLDWEDTKKLAWGILLLFGGGLCIAKALSITGILELFTAWFSNLNPALPILLFLTTFLALFLTELMSNVALVSIYLPLLISLGQAFNLSPYYLTVPATIAASCAFMLPISTPPNAIVFSSNLIRMKQMMLLGVILNIICLICIAVFSHFFIDFLL